MRAPNPPPEGIEDSKDGGRVPAIVKEMRIRTVELMMLRSTSTYAIVQHAMTRWKISDDTARSLMLLVRRRWTEEWKADPTRLDARNRAVKSLEHAVEKLHEIIRSTITKKVKVDGKDVAKTFYINSPKERIAAMGVLAKVEATLSKISGYMGVEQVIPAGDIPEAPAPKAIATTEPHTAPGGSKMGNVVEYTDYFRRVKIGQTPQTAVPIEIKAEVVEADDE